MILKVFCDPVEHSSLIMLKFVIQNQMLSRIFLILSSLCFIMSQATQMEKLNFNCSDKDIPIPSRREILLEYFHSVTDLVKRMRFKADVFLNPQKYPKIGRKQTFGFNTMAAPPSTPLMADFEDGMANLVENIKTGFFTDNFQQNLNTKRRFIKNSEKMIVSADKTTNYYAIPKEDYEDLRTKNITNDYKKTDYKHLQKATKREKEITTNLEIADRVHAILPQESFVTLKDHKPNFVNNPKCRLLNPTKSNLGRIS